MTNAHDRFGNEARTFAAIVTHHGSDFTAAEKEHWIKRLHQAWLADETEEQTR